MERDTHWVSLCDGYTGWSKGQSDGSSEWSSARNHGMARGRLDSQTGCEDWLKGREELSLE